MKRLDDFRFENRIHSCSEAIRRIKSDVSAPGASEVSSEKYKQQISEAMSNRQKDLETIAKSIEPQI